MEEKPLHQLVKQHFSSCLLSGTKIKDASITVSMDKKQDEIIYFFHTDSIEGRKCLDLVNKRCCDCLVFYTKEGKVVEILGFLELKSIGFHDAAEQIISTYQRVKKLLDKYLDRDSLEHITLTACNCMRHQAPIGGMHSLAKLKSIFGEHVYRFHPKQDFGSLIRKLATE